MRSPRPSRQPQNHRTIDRVTRILEEVVYRPGISFAELVRVLDASKSSVHGFINGLLATGWLFEDQRKFYLGPAVYGLTLASGHIRAGLVGHADLDALHRETGLAAFLGVPAGDHLIYVSEAGSDPVTGFEARTNIRRTLLETAGGKVLLAARPEAECEQYLRRCGADEADRIHDFLTQLPEIRKTRLAVNIRKGGTRQAIATTLTNSAGHAVASVTLVGPSALVEPRLAELGRLLLARVKTWSERRPNAREAI